MNNQFSPGAHPEVRPANPVAGAVNNRTPGAGGEIIFNQPPSLTGTEDPNEVIERGKIVGIEVYRQRALDAIGAPIPENIAT